MLPKPKRIKDKKAAESVKQSYSEISGEQTHGAPPHHIYSVGSGGPDHRFNLIQTTGNEHVACHSGEYSKEFLFGIVAEREGLPVDYIIAEVERMRREAHCQQILDSFVTAAIIPGLLTAWVI